jgi:sulfotransferase family protein
MDTYEVLSVSLAKRPPELQSVRIEAPEAGSSGDAYVLPIAGWVVGRDEKPTAVEVLYNERVLRSVPVRGARSDVQDAYPDLPPGTDCQFRALVGLVGLKLESELSLKAILADERRVPLASITVRRRPIGTDFEPTIQPLILTSLARTGTTMLMKAFTSHPEILVFRRFPYEYSVARYWLHMLRVLSEPADLRESAHPDRFQSSLHWVGRNPYHDLSVYSQPSLSGWCGRAYVEQLAAFCQTSIEGWYSALARDQSQDAPAYFAEKMWPGFLPVLTWELYPKAKEIILVRDFRDVVCSMLSFDSKRDYSNFRTDGKSEEAYIRDEMGAAAAAMQRSWQTRRDRAHLVRYEDMVLQPIATLTALLDYLELDPSPQLVSQLLSQVEEDVPDLPGAITDPYLVEIHRTFPDSKDTIGRWRQESGDSRKDLYWDAFGEALEEFGYTKSGSLD